MLILENIDINIDKAILQNIDIDKISNGFKFGISNRARAKQMSNVECCPIKNSGRENSGDHLFFNPFVSQKLHAIST